MTYPTPESLREMSNESMDHVPAEIREGVRETFRAAATRRRRGWIARCATARRSTASRCSS